MRIVKMDYSRSPWRLVTSDGRQVATPSVAFDHPDIGRTMIGGVVMGETKAECTERALALLELLLK